jgi:hypothetical protein
VKKSNAISKKLFFGWDVFSPIASSPTFKGLLVDGIREAARIKDLIFLGTELFNYSVITNKVLSQILNGDYLPKPYSRRVKSDKRSTLID